MLIKSCFEDEEYIIVTTDNINIDEVNKGFFVWILVFIIVDKALLKRLVLIDILWAIMLLMNLILILANLIDMIMNRLMIIMIRLISSSLIAIDILRLL